MTTRDALRSVVIFFTCIGVALWFAIHGQWLYVLGAFVAWWPANYFDGKLKGYRHKKECEQARKECDLQEKKDRKERDDLPIKLQREEKDRKDSEDRQKQEAERDDLTNNSADYTVMGGLFSAKKHLFSNFWKDYSTLRDALAEGNWQSADDLTMTHIKQLIYHGFYDSVGVWHFYDYAIESSDLAKIPLSDLLTMDRLWSQFSGGRYGFGIQLQLYAECEEDFDVFRTRVQWDKNPEYSGSAPNGHLPNGLYYYHRGFVLRRGSRSQRKRIEHSATRPLPPESKALPEDWYENREIYRRTESSEEDGWTFDPIKKDWHRTVVEDYVSEPEQRDPSNGFNALVDLMKRIDFLEKTKGRG